MSSHDRFYTKSALILGWRRRSLASKESLLSLTLRRFWKISLCLTQEAVRIVKELCSYFITVLALLKAIRFVFLQLNLLFELDSNRTYYVICPTCCSHCIPCLMCFKVIPYCLKLWRGFLFLSSNFSPWWLNVADNYTRPALISWSSESKFFGWWILMEAGDTFVADPLATVHHEMDSVVHIYCIY